MLKKEDALSLWFNDKDPGARAAARRSDAAGRRLSPGGALAAPAP
jgi:hypothetical protein